MNERKRRTITFSSYLYVYISITFSSHIQIIGTLFTSEKKVMRSTGYGGFIDCSWDEIENYLQQTENDFQRMGKLGGG